MKPWTGVDGKVVEYRQPHKELLEERSTPKQTGFAKHLYANENKDDPAEKQALESGFMSWVDNNASNAHQHLLVSQRETMATDLIIDWTRFLMSLLHRSPDRIAYLNAKISTYDLELVSDIKERYHQHRGPNDPETFEDWLELRPNLLTDSVPDIRVGLLRSLIDSPRVGTVLANMKWEVIRFASPKFGFLTGDLPLMISDGLESEKSFVLLAISPKDLFVAATKRATIEYFRSQTQKALETACNDACVRQSRHVIVAANGAQRTFISKRFLKVGLETGTNGLATWNNPLIGL
jgi:Protein of unknown function (DUF4238)